MSSDSAIHAIAGAAGGMVAMTATYPLIFLSTRAAVETSKESKSTYQAVVDIVKREGVFGLYSGLNSSLLGIAVTNGVYYFFYERTRSALISGRPAKGLSTVESMLAGLLAGTATSVLSNPLWVIQTSQAVRTMDSNTSRNAPEGSDKRKTIKKLGVIETAQMIVEKDGPLGFWRGLSPALVLVLNPIIQYTAFEQLKNLLIARRTSAARAKYSVAGIAILTDLDYLLLGAISKLIATSLTYPYLVVKSRLQAGHAHTPILAGLRDILRREGIAGLYKGLESKLVQSVLTAAILFAGQRRIYETTKTLVTPLAASKE